MLVLLALMAQIGRARADEPTPGWEVEARAGWIVLGATAPRATGGLMPQMAARRVWPVAEHLALGAGINGGAFGLGGPPRWIGVLAGVHGQAAWRPSTSVSLALTLKIDAGRVPTCSWICLRYEGIFPAGELSASWMPSGHAGITTGLSTRFVNTLGWTGLAWEPFAGGRLTF